MRRPASATLRRSTGFTRDDLVRFQTAGCGPDNMEMFVVSDLPLAEVQPQLERALRQLGGAGRRPRASRISPPPRRGRPSPRIVLIDRPGSPQSVILGGQLTPVDPFGDVVPVTGANDVLGGNFLSRINMDLRETKGWSYGVRRLGRLNVHAVPYLVSAPVQADRTGDSIKALRPTIATSCGEGRRPTRS